MPLDLDSLADLVVLTVKDAIAPLREELALVKQENAHLRASLAVVPDLRDRIVTVETKAATPVTAPAPDYERFSKAITDVEQKLARWKDCMDRVDADVATLMGLRDRVVVIETKALNAPLLPELPPPVDLMPVVTPILERITAIEHQQETAATALATVAELRDRVVAVETKAGTLAIPDPVDLTPLAERLAAVESHVPRLTTAEQTLGELRERVTTVETKSAEVTPLQAIAEGGPSAADVELAIRQRLDPVIADVTAVRERVIAVEARAPIPGPPGKDGQHGKDGAPGRDGVDGLGFDDMDVEFDDRTLTLKFARGSQTKTWPITLPYLGYQGVYIEGKSYDRGDVVTFAGSTWHANKDQTRSKPGDDSKDWTLIVKRGRDGRDGKDGGAAPPAMPVVKVR